MYHCERISMLVILIFIFFFIEAVLYWSYVNSHNLNDGVDQFMAVTALMTAIYFYPLMHLQSKLLDESEAYCSDDRQFVLALFELASFFSGLTAFVMSVAIAIAGMQEILNVMHTIIYIYLHALSSLLRI